ncbi:UNVERIFIED_CONTAM: hypothetical protein PYX00_010432 [Menopon gallinae]|uniref:BMP and activin membrane-bound inhibitor homolog n=1 Tax=Menopon gallinae TaxID=328185 RepID=A0AAW2HG72_9NEOP
MGLLCVVLLVSFFFAAKCEKIRCYCNLEECRPEGDSCSMEDGGCFSDFLDYRDITRARHGCLHLLDRRRQEQCRNAPVPSGGPRSLLLCCRSDMCNQVLSPVSLVTHPIIGSLINATEGHNISGRMYDHRNNTNEVWFKAATIAVPICGAMILLMLVALAFKILRTDHVNVEKYRSDANSNANFNSHIFSFKSNDLNPKDLAKKVPLLYEARQFEVRNEADFRNFTATRIHYGQNVNVLREKEEIGLNKMQKNAENARMNLERPQGAADQEDADEAEPAPRDPPEQVRVEVEDPRVLATLSLNLDKNDCLNSCNLYKNQRTEGEPSTVEVCGDSDKLYDKYWL